ncbi:MAG TPA: hypothetical protein VD907_05515 [Verrucomicrobiae bacterium]|nr:hypothetical protein [Verrucomicrobiae bacterium]
MFVVVVEPSTVTALHNYMQSRAVSLAQAAYDLVEIGLLIRTAELEGAVYTTVRGNGLRGTVQTYDDKSLRNVKRIACDLPRACIREIEWRFMIS